MCFLKTCFGDTMGFHGVEWVKLGFFFMVYGHPSMGIQA
jgi:hypothetical protein